MKYLKSFETLASFQSVSYTLDTPNVSLIEATMEVNYLPIEKRVICKYNVTSTSSATALRTNYDQNIFKSMEIDGVLLNELVTEYTFDTIGIHIVKYELYDSTKLGYNSPTFYNDNLIEVIIPNCVTTISNNTFLNCGGLTSVTIPNSVININNQAFQNCINVTNINIPNSIINIEMNAFNNCSSITSIEIPNSVTSIGGAAFSKCNNLTNLIYNAQCSILQGLFSSLTNLETVIIGNYIPSIGNGAFNNCISLISLTINSVTPPTLGTDALTNTNDCPIYVPAESVDTYKAESGWGEYASRIQAIPS